LFFIHYSLRIPSPRSSGRGWVDLAQRRKHRCCIAGDTRCMNTAKRDYIPKSGQCPKSEISSQNRDFIPKSGVISLKKIGRKACYLYLFCTKLARVKTPDKKD